MTGHSVRLESRPSGVLLDLKLKSRKPFARLTIKSNNGAESAVGSLSMSLSMSPCYYDELELTSTTLPQNSSGVDAFRTR
ncbi:hypothetical protein PoB_002200300 [Plakobranchus ocellatus]|uniref:C2 NT-type domain-containing protein n=1 Tax=Plakobranchus ocellatus TaxID=259542 RepID=A0AAV3ZM14_9GAST|nr:hypothetical protein PoB_002200300 [Plakobranchus ocellatus]